MLGIWVKFDRIVFWFSQVFPIFLSVSLLTENSFLLFENLQTQQRVFQQNRLEAAVRCGLHQGPFLDWRQFLTDRSKFTDVPRRP